MTDMVNNPPHYTQAGIECIEAIEAATVGKSGFEGALVANVIKYLWRYEAKNGLQDVQKARWYVERLTAHLELIAAPAAAQEWPDETRRQDAAAEDEAFTAIEASQSSAEPGFFDAPAWDSHSWPQIVKDEDGNWWGVKAGWKMSISHGWKGDYFSILNGDGELLKRGHDPMNWRNSLQQRPYTGEGGVMLCLNHGRECVSCECRP